MTAIEMREVIESSILQLERFNLICPDKVEEFRLAARAQANNATTVIETLRTLNEEK